jgi:hypothetical protein
LCGETALGPKFASFLAEVDQDCAGFKNADRLAAWACGIDDRGDATVWVDLQKGRIELFALENIDRVDGLGQSHFLNGDTDFATIRGIPSVELDAHRTSTSTSILTDHTDKPGMSDLHPLDGDREDRPKWRAH